MGCGNSKEAVNTNAHGKGKVGADKNGNIKNAQKGRGGKGRGQEAKSQREPREPREPVNEKGYKKRIRQNLREAAAGSDIEELEQALVIFEKNKLEDNGDHTDATERLKFLYLRKELRDAILRRHPEVLDRAISRVESSEYRSDLSHSLETAKRLRVHLTELDQYRHDILTMDQLTISEIRSYHHPPEGVHEVMMGTYMLLGYEEEKIKDWTDVQCLLGRYGKESLMREVRNADTININSKTSQRVLNMQSKFSLEQIRSVSNGAATFYVWNDKMANKSDKDRQDQNTSQTVTPGKASGKSTPAPSNGRQSKPNPNKPQANPKGNQPPKGQQQPKANDKKQGNPNQKDKNPPQPKPNDKNKAAVNPQDKKPAQQPTKDKTPAQPNAKDKNPPQPNAQNKNPAQPNSKDKNPAQPNAQNKNPAQPNSKDKNSVQPNQKSNNAAQPNTKDKQSQQSPSGPNAKNKTPANPVQPNSKDKSPAQPNSNQVQSNKQTDQNKNMNKSNVNTVNQKNQQNSSHNANTAQPNAKSKSNSQQATTDRKKTKG